MNCAYKNVTDIFIFTKFTTHFKKKKPWVSSVMYWFKIIMISTEILFGDFFLSDEMNWFICMINTKFKTTVILHVFSYAVHCLIDINNSTIIIHSHDSVQYVYRCARIWGW